MTKVGKQLKIINGKRTFYLEKYISDKSHGVINSIPHSDVNLYETYDQSLLNEARIALQQEIVEISDLSSTSPSSVVVSWKTDGSTVYVEGLLLHFRPSTERYEEFQTVILRDNHASSYVINNLKGGTEYDMFIQPFYSMIVGLPTSIRKIRTEPEVVPGKTVILLAEMINVTTAFVVWQPYPSAVVTGYEVSIIT